MSAHPARAGGAAGSAPPGRVAAPAAMRRHARIGIEAHGLAGERTGVGNYLARLVEAMGRVAPDEDIALYLHTPAREPLPFPSVRVPPSPLWTTARLAMHLAAHGGPRVMLYPAHSLPLWTGRSRSVVTIHDLAFELFPRHFTRADRLRLRAITRHAVLRADLLLADSDATRDDLVRVMGVPESRVRRVHLGVDARFAPPPPGVVAEVRSRYGLSRPFILMVGTLQARKNHATLIRALPLLHARGVDVDLVAAGGKGWLFDETMRLVRDLGMEAHVRFLGYVPDEDLPGLYGAAEAAALVSLYEGFGLPVLEAMACGAPVLVSNVSSLPEVGGDAVLMVEPLDVEAVADALARLVLDSSLRAELRARAPRHLRRFSWDRTARETLDVLNEVA